MNVHYAVAFLLALATAQAQLIPLPTIKLPTIPTVPTGGAKGDPIMTGLDGRSFEFFGKAGSTYNVLSEKNHQISMTLKEGQMWDHEGTYMKKVGVKYGEHTVEVSNEEDELTVVLDGKALTMLPSQTEHEVLLGLVEGELGLLWQLHRNDYGNAVEISTDLLKLVVWVTPAGTRDEGGKLQPAYLNFDLTLLATPAHNVMKGILGQTYTSATTPVTKAEENDFKFHGVEAEFEIDSLFQTGHTNCVFGKASSVKARRLSEVASATFPMRATSRGAIAVRKEGVLGRKGL